MDAAKNKVTMPGESNPSGDGMAGRGGSSKIELPDSNEGRFIRHGLLLILSVFGILGAWMAYAPIESAAVAPGKVGAEAKKKSIQHLEGGIVQTIHVKEGDSVKQGQVLLQLDETKARAQLDMVLSQYHEALALESRLLAERDGLPRIVFAPEVEALDPEVGRKLVDGQNRLFTSRRDSLASEKAIMLKRIMQLEKQIEGNRSIIKSKQARLESLREEIKEWKELFEEELTDKIRLRELGREAGVIEGDIASLEAEMARLHVQINETESQSLLREQEFDKEVGTQLRDVQSGLADMRARLFSLRDTLDRTEVIAPVGGVVVGMDAHTIGGVIPPGKTMLDIVPAMSELIVTAQVKTTDIDKVKKGLKAIVRFSAFNLQTAEVVEGEVVHVSADSFVDKVTGVPYYEAEIRLTEEGREKMKKNGFFLISGMPAEVMIKTGKRTVLSYLMKPLIDRADRAFRED